MTPSAARLDLVEAVEQILELPGCFFLQTEFGYRAQEALRRLGAHLPPDIGGKISAPVIVVAVHRPKNPMSTSKLLQHGNGSRILPQEQAKLADTVKFELIWNDRRYWPVGA
ncbi:hypothetical protein AB6802_22495 [Mesorhizobium sp. RCC_202]